MVSMRDLLTQMLLFFLTVAKVMNEEQRINVCKTSLNQIYNMLRTSPQDWRNYLTLARTVITHLDTTTFMQKPDRTSEQVWMIAAMQRLAFMDADSGGVVDIASWCLRQWLNINQREPTSLAALRGIGQVWLSRAQPTLAKIHRAEGHSSSSTTSQLSVRSTNDSTSAAEAERRAGSSDYVEARGFLQPATEYFERAIAAATSQQNVSGDLLATAAEAYMSLGNTSSPRINQQYFGRAIQLLRAATSIPGYTLSRYLQMYLDEYGKLLEEA
ncbi:hypothetical protein AC578_10191 [Pseudocercospora eumusae]|uniref:FAT domain-containing protein n=1 Tax=Pseudocercospora eumusae TaxID=321146 RepID=A0A139HYL9_9PEZI|nr:hypothetical protein AC578_10191 [Pseudocercospora eumusae]